MVQRIFGSAKSMFVTGITFENVLYLIYDIFSIGSFASELLAIMDYMSSAPIHVFSL
jgi:hypothetical protein